MKLACLIVAILLFLLDFFWPFVPNKPAWALTPLGLAFFAASFLPMVA